MTAAELNPEFRNLIDARLDAIEQILLRVQVSYSERRHIVGEVETQIFELLSRRGETFTREEVVAVLNSLDPPESYIPEELRGRLRDATIESAPAKPKGPRVSRLAVGSAGLVGVLLLLAAVMMASSMPQERDVIAVYFGVNLFLASLLGFFALVRVLRSNGRLRGMPFALFAAIAFPLCLVNVAAVMLAVATHGVLPWVLTIAGLVYLNYLGVRRLWRWLGERHASIANALRGDFTGWFAPKNGIQPT
ncbi:MAG: hypothetical protein ACM3U2_11985 [Deltaproteobacteria bacterium]